MSTMEKLSIIIFAFSAIQLASGSYFSNSDAQTQLENAGIYICNMCTESQGKHCVSLYGLREDTLCGLVKLKEKSKCSLLVTGGTEPGHYNHGIYTHENGYRINIKNTECVYKYIASHATCKIFESPKGDVELVACEDQHNNNYALVENQWDIGFFPKGDTYLSVLARLLSDWKGKDLGNIL